MMKLVGNGNMSEIEYSTNKAIWHTEKIHALQNHEQIAPTEIQIDLEAYCNDNCSFCSYRKEDGYNNEMLKLIKGEAHEEFKPIGKPSPASRIPDEFADILPTQMVEANIPAIEITGGGEPTLWPKFDKLVKNLHQLDIEIGLVTNGSNLSNDRINLISKACLWIRISMDAATQETHKKIHRTGNDDFERRLQNIRRIAIKKHKDLVLGISFIITPDNFKEIEETCELYSSIKGINSLRFSWMYDKEGKAGLTQYQIDIIRQVLDKRILAHQRKDFHIFYEKDRIDLYSRPNDDFNTCYYQRFVWAIGADCKVYPCCIMKYHPDYAFGDISNYSLKYLIEKMAEKMDNLDVTRCRPCWLRNRNKAIGRAVEKPIHHNFI